MSRFFYGGQAVIEGVMMRGRTTYAVAVRLPSGQLIVAENPLPSSLRDGKLQRIPLVRGVLLLWEMMVLGLRSLSFSANAAIGANEAKLEGPTLWATLLVSLTLAIALFMLAPLVGASLLDQWVGSDVMSNLIEGTFRLGILVLYLAGIGFVPEIRRVFCYHGAEHKTINAFEAGEPLTVEAVRRHSLQHPRCGTGFLLLVVAVSVVVFAFLGRPDPILRVVSRIVLVPVIAALAYEIVRLAATYYRLPAVRLAMAPSMALQRLTTREPDPAMIEVAIAALATVLRSEGSSVSVARADTARGVAH